MKKTVLFGAGQVGAMLFRLMGAEQQVLCFADNSPEKRGGDLLGVPVITPGESLLLQPELICLCVLDAARADAMEAQLRALGYSGEVFRPDALRLLDARSAAMRMLAEQIISQHIPGDAAELGVFRGDFAALINAALPERALHLFDTFTGFAPEDVRLELERGYSSAKAGDFSQTGAELVRGRLPYPQRAVFHVGRFPGTFDLAGDVRLAFVSVDADLYAPTAAALPLFWERLSPGGVLMIHDVNGSQYTGAGAAVGEFCAEKGLFPFPLCDLHGSVALRKP